MPTLRNLGRVRALSAWRHAGDPAMLDPDTTEQDDLREGDPPWRCLSRGAPPRLARDTKCDVLVVGAGITGALMAEHLSARGHDVCVIDRERPGFGSTLASTAMLLWEIDRPLAELADFYGFETAADVYRRSHAAVQGLAGLVGALGLPCGFSPRASLYLAAGDAGPATLRAELAAREKAGLPGVFLDHPALLGAFGFDREAAILSPGSADVDPLLLAHGLCAAATKHGARFFTAEAKQYDGTDVETADGIAIEARHVVLATGYVMPDIVTSNLHDTGASWAIATPPQPPGALWRDRALVWEASENYLYARTTTDGRIVIGGEDETGMTDPAARAALAPQKARAILAKLQALRPQARARAERIWSGVFGTTQDGLPLVGAVPGHPRVFAAYGYGGNGITFSYMASRMIAAMIEGRGEDGFDTFALDRPPV